MDWPLSIMGDDGVIGAATTAELTVTATVFELARLFASPG
jgi:hypothetical protein